MSEAYFSHPAISASDLKKIKKSPLHFQWAKTHRSEPTPAMRFGTASHEFIWEPAVFEEKYAICPYTDKRKADYKDWCKENEGKEILTAKDVELLEQMRDTCRKHPVVRRVMDHEGHVELEKYWSNSGLDFRAKVDKWIPGLNMLIDYKTTMNAGADAFGRSAYGLGYHIQAAHYQDGFAEDGIQPSFLFIAQEKDGPCMVNVFQPDEDFVEAGRQERERLIKIYKQCVQHDRWVSYDSGIKPLSVPPWVKNKGE